MEVWTVINGVIALVLAGATGFLVVTRATVQAATTTAATKAVENAIDRIDWPRQLGQELEKTRGVERQELRFQSYDRLWASLRPLALYADEAVDAASMDALSRALSDWYFSELGGMYMTSHVREYYFALQDLLRIVAGHPDWTAKRTALGHGERFAAILEERGLGDAASIRAKFKEGRHAPAAELLPDSRQWRLDIRRLGGAWSELSDDDRFVILQQVASQLRTALAMDVESRLR